jgi:hypothetical protein
MKIVTELKKQEASSDLNNDYRTMKGIKAGDYIMSVQGSTTHYCSPRTTEAIEDYSCMELALFNKKGWLHINRSSVIKSFPRYNELLERADSVNSSAPVFAYVPMDLLNDLYVYLNGA